MTPAVAEILRRMPPPADPIFHRGDWTAVEKDVGIQFPTDYKELIGAYGSVRFCGLFWILNPFYRYFRPEDNKPFRQRLSGAERVYTEDALSELSHPLYPAPGGLIPCGATDNAGLFSWVPTGRPDEWHILVFDFPIYLHELPGVSLSQFILGLITRQPGFVPEIFPEDFFEPDRIVAERDPVIDPDSLGT